ncbi:MAG: hypothetical protein ACK46Z_11110, partial [Bacteroidota bacterium]
MNRLLLVIAACLCFGTLHAQELAFNTHRISSGAALPGYSKEEMLKKEFSDRKLAWPARQIYIRSFKYDSQLEVWVRNNASEAFQLFKTYRICTLSGALGPKRYE